jgi:hypothetical protein
MDERNKESKTETREEIKYRMTEIQKERQLRKTHNYIYTQCVYIIKWIHDIRFAIVNSGCCLLKFWKFSTLVSFLCKVTKEPTFENSNQCIATVHRHWRKLHMEYEMYV